MIPSDKCPFDKNGQCYALLCCSSQQCGARDESGYPYYCDNEEVVTAYENRPK